jgi:hypothetical protein
MAGYSSFMQRTTTPQGERSMSPTMEVSCRVDYRAINPGLAREHTSRVDSLSVTGCTIRTGQVPGGEALELRIYLPDGKWPLRIDHAKVSWGHWDGFTVEFLSMPAKDQQRIQEYLAHASGTARGVSLGPDAESFASEREVWA